MLGARLVKDITRIDQADCVEEVGPEALVSPTDLVLRHVVSPMSDPYAHRRTARSSGTTMMYSLTGNPAR